MSFGICVASLLTFSLLPRTEAKDSKDLWIFSEHSNTKHEDRIRYDI